MSHSGAKSYLMADTQFMAGPPFSQWQVTFFTGKALWKGRAKDRVLHSWKEEHKCCAWEMKWEKSSWFAHSAAAQLMAGYRPQPADLTVPDWDLTCSGRCLCFSSSRRALISFWSWQSSCLGFWGKMVQIINKLTHTFLSFRTISYNVPNNHTCFLNSIYDTSYYTVQAYTSQ